MGVEKKLWEERKRSKGVEVELRAMEYVIWEQEGTIWGKEGTREWGEGEQRQDWILIGIKMYIHRNKPISLYTNQKITEIKFTVVSKGHILVIE